MRIFIDNLPFRTTETALRTLFAPYGEVQRVKIQTTATGKSAGYGYIEYTREADAREALTALQGAELDRRPLRLNLGSV